MTRLMRCICICVAATTLLLMHVGGVSGCPSVCICKWKSGKQTVECTDKGLVAIPDGMDSGTQVLEFAGNDLHALLSEKFLQMDLINLQRIYMSRCRVAIVDERTFRGLTNLVELDLSENALVAVPSAAFVDSPSLMRLILTGNPIRQIETAAFSHLSFLNTLELSRCEIKTIDEDAFLGLNSLEWLRLDSNQMSAFGSRRILPDNLRGVDLHGNPWECDCHLRELRTWLAAYTVPQSIEPVCAAPPKFARRAIKAIPAGELACLPDVSPTSFYLEIGEGKNISLLCQVHAVPQAKVSWWFQGQTLQNDTLVGPDMRFMYFVEEGVEEKRSELFIYNANSQDNGTFVCSAENPAGATRSNFTIRVILKEEPHEEVVALPFEFIVIIMSATGISLLVILFAIILSVVKCHRAAVSKRRKHNKDLDKMSSLNNSTKDSLLQESIEDYSDLSKESSNVTLVDRQQMIFYGGGGNEGGGGSIRGGAIANEDFVRALSPIVGNGNPMMQSPSALRRYQLEQNPDLINDTTESVVGRRRDASATSDVDMSSHSQHANAFISQQQQQLHEQSVAQFELASVLMPHGAASDMYRFSADVHLNPVGLLTAASSNAGSVVSINNSSGGGRLQQQAPTVQPMFVGPCYRTLPYNRGAAKRQLAATASGSVVPNPAAMMMSNGQRYAREAEFVSLSVQPASFEHYRPPDIRYTVDGYPVRGGNSDEIAEETQFTEEGSVRSCCSAPPVQWPPCVSAMIRAPSSDDGSTSGSVPHLKPILKKCVGAQTQTDSVVVVDIATAQAMTSSSKPPVNKPVSSIAKISDTLTESPDEGYGGDSTDTSANPC